MSQNKMPPDKYSQMINHLTRKKIKNPFIPDSAIERPKKILEIEAFQDFNKRNPKADGGMLVQPGFGGTRQGYAEPVGGKKGIFTTKAMDNVSDAILKAYAEDDISLLFEKGKSNPQGLLTPKDSKAAIFQKIKTDQDRLNTVVKNTGLDQETILDIIDDRDAYYALEKTTVSQKTRYKNRDKFFNQAEKWLTTNAKRYSDPVKFEKAFARTFGKNNLITKTIRANITEARGKGRISGFSDDFVKTIMSVREGTTKADNAFNSIQLKDMFKTVIYNNNPNVRKRITAIFENIIPKPGSRRTPDIRNLFANDPVLKKFGLNKSIKGPIARLIANEINEDLLTNVKNFQRPFLGTDALLSFLKDRVDPKYKEMFREASNAVKQAQKNQWPQAKKTLNLSQAIMFDHKIPKSIIDLGYADEIEYIKLNPTSEKFNATIKRSQFDTPMNELIRKFEQTKTLDGKAAVVKEMNTLKNNFSKKYGGYLDEVTIIPDKTGKPIFKSSAAPVTKKTDFVSSLGKSMVQAGEIDEKQFKKLVATLGGGDCGRGLKNQGGRVGLQDGTPNVNVCFKNATQRINSGFKNATSAEARNYTKLLNAVKGSAVIGRNLLKFGIVPEALYVGADSLIRMGFGDTFEEAGLRAIDFFIPGDQMQEADKLKVQRTLGDSAATNVGRVFDYRNQIANINSLEQQKQNFENLSGGGAFEYVGDLSQDIKNIDTRLNQAKNDLQNKFMVSEAETVAADQALEEAYDISKAKSPLARLKLFAQNIEAVQDDPFLSDIATPQKTQMDLNLDMFPTLPTGVMGLKTSDAIDLAQALRAEGQNVSAKDILAYRDELKQMPLMDAANQFGREQVFGAQGTFFGQPLAGGGLAKLAGDRSGRPPERGPNSQGLLSLMKRGMKI